MTRILTVASQKGGVGKTTTALNLGYMLGRLGDKVLVVDADPQGGMAIASNLRKRTEMGLVQLLSGQLTPEEVITHTRDGSLSMVGSGVVEPEDTESLEGAARNGDLQHALESLVHGFDYVFIDAPAGVGGLVTALLGASDDVLLMLRCRALSLKSLPAFLKLIRYVRRDRNPRLRLEGTLVTMYHADSALESEFLAELETTMPEALVFRTVVKHDQRFEAASIRSLPVSLLPDGRDVARPYLELAIEFKEREAMRRFGGEVDEHVEGLF